MIAVHLLFILYRICYNNSNWQVITTSRCQETGGDIDISWQEGVDQNVMYILSTNSIGAKNRYTQLWELQYIITKNPICSCQIQHYKTFCRNQSPPSYLSPWNTKVSFKQIGTNKGKKPTYFGNLMMMIFRLLDEVIQMLWIGDRFNLYYFFKEDIL